MAKHANYMELRMETNESVSTNGGDLTTGEHDRPHVRPLALDDITVDESVQARAQMLGEDVVEEYAAAMQEGDQFPALVVFQQSGTYVLADGFTRYAAAKCAGLTEFDCAVHEGGLRDAMLYAVGANGAHGRPRSAADKRSAVLKMLADDEWRGWSARRIAQLCRVSHQLVLEVMSATGRANSQVTYKGRYGVRKMNVRRMKKPSTDSGSAGQSDSAPTRADKDETKITAGTAFETAAREISVIDDDKPSVGEVGQVYAGQHVGPDEALAMVTEFARFIIARIHDEGECIVVTITLDDADLLRSLRNRAELVIRNESVAHDHLNH
jgi:hypothetical protein